MLWAFMFLGLPTQVVSFFAGRLGTPASLALTLCPSKPDITLWRASPIVSQGCSALSYSLLGDRDLRAGPGYSQLSKRFMERRKEEEGRRSGWKKMSNSAPPLLSGSTDYPLNIIVSSYCPLEVQARKEKPRQLKAQTLQQTQVWILNTLSMGDLTWPHVTSQSLSVLTLKQRIISFSTQGFLNVWPAG